MPKRLKRTTTPLHL